MKSFAITSGPGQVEKQEVNSYLADDREAILNNVEDIL